jgi:hypothetical protein
MRRRGAHGSPGISPLTIDPYQNFTVRVQFDGWLRRPRRRVRLVPPFLQKMFWQAPAAEAKFWIHVWRQFCQKFTKAADA